MLLYVTYIAERPNCGEFATRTPSKSETPENVNGFDELVPNPPELSSESVAASLSGPSCRVLTLPHFGSQKEFRA